MAKVYKIRVTKPQMETICERIAEGESLTRICNNTKSLPSWRTVLRWVQENDYAHTMYRKARALQCEVMRDQILDLVNMALPDDPKLAMAEVQRRRLQADHMDKHIRQMQPLVFLCKHFGSNLAHEGFDFEFCLPIFCNRCWI